MRKSHPAAIGKNKCARPNESQEYKEGSGRYKNRDCSLKFSSIEPPSGEQKQHDTND
jgi:hypothetical protein